MGITTLSTQQLRDGAAVTRQDLDTTSSSKAVIAKAVQGTGISLSSSGVDAGTGDVTINLATGTALSITSSLLDLNGIGTVIDDDFHTVPILIPDTTKPAAPQYTKQILSANIPNNSDIFDWGAVLSIGGKNTDVSSRTLNFLGTVNGTEKTTQSSITVAAGNFWWAMFVYRSVALAANDTLGIKMWGSVTNVLDYRVADSYVVPRTLAHPNTNNEIASVYVSTGNYNLSGGIATVTYTSQSLGSQQILVDTSVSASPISILASGMGIMPLIKGQMAWNMGNVISDSNNFGTGAAMTLFQPSNLIRYIRTNKMTT